MSKVDVDKEDMPLVDVVVSNCGELERKRRPGKALAVPVKDGKEISTSRGRHHRRRTSTPNRSPSPSRGHGRHSASRYRHHHRRHHRDDSSSRSATPPTKDRRRSDASPDHNLRGRPRQRSRPRSRSPILEDDSASPEPKHYRKRSPPPSRPRSKSPGHRRQRSLPNQYNNNWKEEERLKRSEHDREGDRYMEDSSGRLGGNGSEWDNMASGDGVKYKGRGAMKFRENRGGRW
jgi:peptidyl-prolyl isomerase G (cyclophilin G)